MKIRTAAFIFRRLIPGVVLGGAVTLFAHYTWLSPAPSPARVGETVTVLLSSGHAFPESEEPVRGVELRMTLAGPSGASRALTPKDQGRGPEAAFKVEAEGVYRVAGEYDRGVISRTPEGWKPGGRAEHPGAASVIKAYNSFLCAVRTPAAALGSPEPLGLLFEVSWKVEGRKLVALATAQGKPAEGVEISAILGSGEAKPAGRTGRTGRAEIEVPESFKGSILLTGSLSKPMPAGSAYDEERLSSSCLLAWD
ncbi:MAG TPA: DUF4198 domain-containing protein [Candidatus Aminicenantes bacterium]|nr:DUF4198 domain-containing protein [Candidatus Aminicenantes bacterium]